MNLTKCENAHACEYVCVCVYVRECVPACVGAWGYVRVHVCVRAYVLTQ